MRWRFLVLVLSISLCACQPSEESHSKAIIGAVLLDGLGGPPLSDSVVVVAGERIREAGARFTVAIPEESDKVDGSGRFVTPALVDVYPRSPATGNFISSLPPTPEAARDQVARLAAQKGKTIHLGKADLPVTRAILEAAHEAGIPVIGHVTAQADVRLLVEGGAAGFIGMITDTEELDSTLLARLRDLHIFFAPSLATATAAAGEIAGRNTHRLFVAGVPIALASNGADPIHEAELLVQAGIPPFDVIVAATRNGAAALGQLEQTGTVQAGKQADLLVLSANPGEDIRNLRKVVVRVSTGNWVK